LLERRWVSYLANSAPTRCLTEVGPGFDVRAGRRGPRSERGSAINPCSSCRA